MAQIPRLVSELKRYLKAQGLTYSQIAAQLGLSESSVKRMFSHRAFSLDRLEQICNIAGIEISDLVELMNQHRAYISELTLDQEELLVAQPKLLLMAYHLITGWQLEQITTTFDSRRRRGRSAY